MRRFNALQITNLLLIAFSIIYFAERPAIAEESSTNNPSILFLGDSLTAGYGVKPEQAYPYLIQEFLTRDGYTYRAINSGVSGETTAAGLRRLNWLLREEISILVICLGANDGLRGIHPEETARNLRQMAQNARTKYPDIKIALCEMHAPRSMGEEYTRIFNETFTKVSSTEQITLIPFFLDRVAGIPELNLPDGIHPTAEGHKIMAENMWEAIKPLL